MASNSIIGTSWVPKNRFGKSLPWKVTDLFVSTKTNRAVVQIEKYQGGRNSPAIITLTKLKKNFEQQT